MPVTFQSLIIKDLAKNYSDFVEGCRKGGGVGVVGRSVGSGLCHTVDTYAQGGLDKGDGVDTAEVDVAVCMFGVL